VIGLESSIGVLLTKLVHTKRVSLQLLRGSLDQRPGGRARHAGRADCRWRASRSHHPGPWTVEWTLDVERFHSKARNCPFQGWKLKGGPVYTIIGESLRGIGRTTK
jgi:dihydroorotase